jgi:hypothetical protein
MKKGPSPARGFLSQCYKTEIGEGLEQQVLAQERHSTGRRGANHQPESRPELSYTARTLWTNDGSAEDRSLLAEHQIIESL